MTKENRLVISFDLDGVIFPLVQSICRENGIDYERVTNHDIWRCDRLTKEEKETIVGSFGKRSTYEKCGLIDGAEMLERVAEAADVYINSWCIGEDYEYKREVLKRIAPAIPDDHIFLGRPFRKKTYVISDYIVEDHVRNIRENIDKGKRFILINTPYNQVTVEKTLRVRNLREAMEILLKAAEDRLR